VKRRLLALVAAALVAGGCASSVPPKDSQMPPRPKPGSNQNPNNDSH